MNIPPSNPKQKPDYSDCDFKLFCADNTDRGGDSSAVYFAQALLAKPIPYTQKGYSLLTNICVPLIALA